MPVNQPLAPVNRFPSPEMLLVSPSQGHFSFSSLSILMISNWFSEKTARATWAGFILLLFSQKE